jgi:probable rRNA maturation factor
MIQYENETSLKLSIKLANQIKIDLLITRDIELHICNNNKIKQYNKLYRNINKKTDVLSFPLENINNEPLGTIIISSDFVSLKAKEFNHSNQDEFSLLFIHGLLHLLGYDHEQDNGEMRKEETRLIVKYNLPKSLIIRNEK